MSRNAWIGVDFDGTLAEYDKWISASHVGAPIPAMVARVKRWLAAGKNVRIFTARIFPYVRILHPDQPMLVEPGMEQAFEAACAIAEWSREHIGVVLPITCIKDFDMIELWDDRAVGVVTNTGEPASVVTSRLEVL